jgi:hypothetical protein
MARESHFLGAIAIIIASVVGTPVWAVSIHPGAPTLRAGSLQSGSDTTESFRLDNGMRIAVATITRTVSREQQGSTPVYRVVIRNQSSRGDSSRSETIIDAHSFALISQTVRATSDSGQVAYDKGRLIGWIQAANDSLRIFELKPDSLVFPDDGALPWLVTMLPLGPGKKFELLSFNMWAKREVPLAFTVVREDTVRYRSRLDTCWVVQVTGRGGPPGFDYFNWVSRRTHQLLQAAFLKTDAAAQFWIKRR